MILLIDNYDSFTYNLVQRLGELDPTLDVRVFRNDEVTPDQVAELTPSHIIISPGPCTPRQAGISTDVVRRLGATTPILGVCLGHQCIGEAYGGDVVRAPRPKHGKTSRIVHDGTSVFAGLPSPMRVARYHSLVIAPGTVPDCLRVTAEAEDDGVIMAVRHKELPVEAVQFHPESILTSEGDCGIRLMENVVRQCRAYLNAATLNRAEELVK